MKAISFLIVLVACASQRPKEQDPYHFLQAPMIAKVPQMRDCYMNSPNYIKNPDTEIQTKIEFDLELDGSTTKHKVVESSLKDRKFEECLVSKLKDLKYPPQKESVTIIQRFNFFPRRP